MLIDTHCHLNDPAHFPDVDSEIRQAKAAGVERIVMVGVKPDEWQATIDLAERHEALSCILGWHPNYTADYQAAKLKELEALLVHPKVFAVGEIGLDYHWSYSPKDVQYQAVGDQLDLAAQLDLPVVFHAREAYDDLLTILENRPLRPYLFHCFAGNQDQAERAARLGCYFGVDGPVTYKKADDLRKILKTLPEQRLVVETDAPYLTPVPYRGKPNKPAYVAYVASALAEVLEVSAERCAGLTTENAIRFFGERLR